MPATAHVNVLDDFIAPKNESLISSKLEAKQAWLLAKYAQVSYSSWLAFVPVFDNVGLTLPSSNGLCSGSQRPNGCGSGSQQKVRNAGQHVGSIQTVGDAASGARFETTLRRRRGPNQETTHHPVRDVSGSTRQGPFERTHGHANPTKQCRPECPSW